MQLGQQLGRALHRALCTLGVPCVGGRRARRPRFGLCMRYTAANWLPRSAVSAAAAGKQRLALQPPSVASLRSLFGSDRSPRGFRAAERLGVGSRVLKAWLRARVSPSPGCRTALRCRVWWVPWLRQDCPTTQGQGAVSRRAVAAATTYANSCAATCTRARACGRGVVVCAHWMRICAVRRNCI